jgi:hypothetical protein
MNVGQSFENTQAPGLRLLYTSTIEIEPPLIVGTLATGERRIINITGGTFSGSRLSGRILRGGADWQIIKSDGVTEVEAKYTLETDDGALIYIVNWGLRHGPKEVMKKMMAGEHVDPSQYYFRMTPKFETGADKYSWLNRVVAVATGERRSDAVIITVFEVI